MGSDSADIRQSDVFFIFLDIVLLIMRQVPLNMSVIPLGFIFHPVVVVDRVLVLVVRLSGGVGRPHLLFLLSDRVEASGGDLSGSGALKVLSQVLQGMGVGDIGKTVRWLGTADSGRFTSVSYEVVDWFLVVGLGQSVADLRDVLASGDFDGPEETHRGLRELDVQSFEGISEVVLGLTHGQNF
jgi:hypothetical protein